jgi:nitroreductase
MTYPWEVLPMETQQALITRRSIRRYKTHPIPSKVIEQLIDAARLAPSANNIQPWEFVVVTEQNMRQKIAEFADYGKFIAQAAACIAVFCRETKYYLEDGSAATQNIMLSAWAQGVGSCWVAGDKKPYCKAINQLLGVPEGYKLVSLVALGYPIGTPSPHHKRKLDDVLHWENFAPK